MHNAARNMVLSLVRFAARLYMLTERDLLGPTRLSGTRVSKCRRALCRSLVHEWGLTHAEAAAELDAQHTAIAYLMRPSRPDPREALVRARARKLYGEYLEKEGASCETA